MEIICIISLAVVAVIVVVSTVIIRWLESKRIDDEMDEVLDEWEEQQKNKNKRQ